MHLFEFDANGYYAADTRERAMLSVARSTGCLVEEAREDFLRDVPDDEMIEAIFEDPQGHAKERRVRRDGCYWHFLNLSAAEHAARAPEWGYCFGGEQ